MQILVKILFILIVIFSLSYFDNIFAQNKKGFDLKEKYSLKKLETLEKSVKSKNNYRLIIESNDTLDKINSYFSSFDKKIKVKKVGNNKFVIKIPVKGNTFLDETKDLDSSIIPDYLGNYKVIKPELIQAFSSNYISGEDISKLWGIQKISAETFQESLSSKQKVKVAIIDTGIDGSNIDLFGNYNSSLSHDFINNTGSLDDNGHGTQVAGIIGSLVNGFGTFGVNSNSDLISLKVLDSNGYGTTYDLLEAIDYAKQNNITVLNLSFGGAGDPTNSSVCTAITEAKNAGIFTVVSAGNNNTDVSSIIPAGCSDAIVVGATDKDNTKASFSNYGNNVDIYAPGVDIYTTDLNNKYISKNGTSFSAPFVSGLISKELAYNPNLSYNEILNNVKNNYGLVKIFDSTNNTQTGKYIQIGSDFSIPEENMYLFNRFEDFKYLSIDDNYVYFSDSKKQDKIYKLMLDETKIPIAKEFYAKYPQTIFANKDTINPYYFQSGQYINIDDYPNKNLVSKFLNNSLSGSFNKNDITNNSLGKYQINQSFNLISGKKILKFQGNYIINEGGYIYYHNTNDGGKPYRVKDDGSDVNSNGTKVINLPYAYINKIDGDYIYYQNSNDNYKTYRIKKDGSEASGVGNIVINIIYSIPSKIDGEYIYYLNYNDGNKLYKIKKDGSEADTGGIRLTNTYSWPLFIEGDYVYCQIFDSINSTYNIHKIKNDGSDINSLGLSIYSQGYLMYLFDYLDYIYLFNFNDNSINRIKKDGTDYTKIKTFQFFMMGMNDIFHDNDYIYFTDDMSGGAIYKVRNDGSDAISGGTKIIGGSYYGLMYIDGEYIYYADYLNNGSINRISKYGTENTKLTGIYGNIIKSDIDFIYYFGYNNGNTYYKVKKDGTDDNYYPYSSFTSPEIILEPGKDTLKINVDSIIPYGTDYKFYLSNDNYNFTEIPKNKINGSGNIDLVELFGINFLPKVYFRTELVSNENIQNLTPTINFVELFTGDKLIKNVANVIISGLSNCSYPYFGVKMDLKNSNGTDIFSETKYDGTTSPGGCGGGSWLWGAYYLGNGCSIGEVTMDESNYYIGYICNAVYGRTSGAANGGGFEQSYNWSGNFTVSKSDYDFCSFDSKFCNFLQSPTNLQQQIQSPLLDKQIINAGEKIGKYQSGSGIILSAYIQNDSQKDERLAIEIYKNQLTTPEGIFYSGYIKNGTGEVIIPFLGSGDYNWRIRTENQDGITSEWVNYIGEIDYSLFDGFEPYPYGYNFYNRSPENGLLYGGIYTYYDTTFPYFHNDFIPGNKWDIYESAFNTSPGSGFEKGSLKSLAVFESLGLNRSDAFIGGNCYGMAVSSAMQYTHPDFMQSYHSNFSSKVGIGNIWEKIVSPSTTYEGNWDIFNETLETILSFQLSQRNIVLPFGKTSGITNPFDIITELNNNPNKTYVLKFWGTDKNGNSVGHAVIPYKVKEVNGIKRIYVWDNNVQFPERILNNGLKRYGYNQYLEVKPDGIWSNLIYDRSSFTKMSLINLDDIYNGGNKSTPIGFNGDDLVYTLSGNSDLIVNDSLGRVSGFQSGAIIEEIPGVDVIVPLNATLSGEISENTWKQIYLPNKQDLTVKVTAKSVESYDLMIAGGDYYTKISSVETSTGQVDIYNSKRDEIKIDFDNNKIGDYSLLTDDFLNNQTGSIYIDSVLSNTNPQLYSISWTGVYDNNPYPINYKIDTNNDLIYDKIISLPSIFQDLIDPSTIINFSGSITPNATGSYIETVNIDLKAIDNTGGSGIEAIYYTLENSSGSVYTSYSGSIVVNGLGSYTIHYYSVDNFGNIETVKSISFVLTEKPETYNGIISGFVYDDSNNNGIKDNLENTMAGWKVCIDKNLDGSCQENNEPFVLTNNNGYFEFNGLPKGAYKVIEVPHQNWNITSPLSGYFNLNLSIGQIINQVNFGNIKVKPINK